MSADRSAAHAPHSAALETLEHHILGDAPGGHPELPEPCPDEPPEALANYLDSCFGCLMPLPNYKLGCQRHASIQWLLPWGCNLTLSFFLSFFLSLSLSFFLALNV